MCYFESLSAMESLGVYVLYKCHEARWPPRERAPGRSDSGEATGVRRQPEKLPPTTRDSSSEEKACPGGGVALSGRRSRHTYDSGEAAQRAVRAVEAFHQPRAPCRETHRNIGGPPRQVKRGQGLHRRGGAVPSEPEAEKPLQRENHWQLRKAWALIGQLLQTAKAMPGSKLNHKPASKPARQLLFSEALHHKCLTPTTTGPHASPHPTEPTTMSDKDHPTTMERILQEITTVSRRIEGMDASITSLTLETKSMRSDIAGFQSRVTGLEQRMGSLEAHATASQDRDQDLLYLTSKLTEMEDRSRRDNIRLLGFPENEESTDMQAFLSSTLSKLTSLDFDQPLEFQRAHSVGPKLSDKSSRPRPIIACLLRHNQTRQILQVARSHGPFRVDQHDIRITADYSKETNERRKAFLALRPRLRQLEMKYGLFDPARMWVTKNGVSKAFYNPEELRLFLDSF
ncbi:hypothetical protein NDU88_002046 [Pleurodeles waltl]|uniref:L1 transposable element RRM domain-containing protein n=1 Tax=Pleurodeles waltl TaxID=8319 RepID=A0AAV7VYA0_PLEWA|nr:hypothetical protein NDU88_002046 [Pleurodeles waltl]